MSLEGYAKKILLKATAVKGHSLDSLLFEPLEFCSGSLELFLE